MMAIITGALEGLRGRTVEAHNPDGGGEDPPAPLHEEGQMRSLGGLRWGAHSAGDTLLAPVGKSYSVVGGGGR